MARGEPSSRRATHRRRADEVPPAGTASAAHLVSLIDELARSNQTLRSRFQELKAVTDGLRREVELGARRLQAIIGQLAPGDGSLRLAPPARLGAREREVLRLIADGYRSPCIAEHLGITVATVEVHRRNIMRKLDLHSLVALTKYAVREGLTSL
jgi:DNA-binding NarL/FixJ family response regulator